jgi:hypothetical protein
VAGVEASTSGLNVTVSGDTVSRLNRLSDSGEILRFQKDTATVGSIGVESGDNFIIEASATDHAGLLLWGSGGTGRVTPRLNGANSDGAVDLGRSSQRFKDLYLSGGVYLGGTAAANKLDDYEEGTWTVTATGANAGVVVDVAQYTKIGRLVTIDLRVRWTGANTSALQFSLPFVSSNPGAASRTGAVFYSGTQVFSGAAVSTHITQGGNQVSFYSTAGGNFTQVSGSMVNGSYDWLTTVTYFTDL